MGHHVHLGSFGSFAPSQVVVWFIHVSFGEFGRDPGSLGSFEFVYFHTAYPRSRRVHSRSFGSFEREPWVIRIRLLQ